MPPLRICTKPVKDLEGKLQAMRGKRIHIESSVGEKGEHGLKVKADKRRAILSALAADPELFEAMQEMRPEELAKELDQRRAKNARKVVVAKSKKEEAAYKLNWFTTTGTGILLAALVGILALIPAALWLLKRTPLGGAVVKVRVVPLTQV